MKKYKTGLIFILFLLLSNTLFSDAINGLLMLQMDDMSLMPLADFQIALVDDKGTEKSNLSLTNQNGQFTFSGLPEGNYSVNIYQSYSNWKVLLKQQPMILNSVNKIILPGIPDISPRARIEKDAITLWLNIKNPDKQFIEKVIYAFDPGNSEQIKKIESENRANDFQIELAQKTGNIAPEQVTIMIISDNKMIAQNLKITFFLAKQLYSGKKEILKQQFSLF